MRGDLTLGDFTDDVGHCHIHALQQLGLRLEKRVQHADALRDHRNLKLVHILEVIQELSERHLAFDLEAIPQRPILLVVFLLDGACWLRECQEWKSKVSESVLEAVDCFEAKMIEEVNVGEGGRRLGKLTLVPT